MKYLALILFLIYCISTIWTNTLRARVILLIIADNKISNVILRNSDWSASPDKIYYKLNLDSETKEG